MGDRYTNFKDTMIGTRNIRKRKSIKPVCFATPFIYNFQSVYICLIYTHIRDILVQRLVKSTGLIKEREKMLSYFSCQEESFDLKQLANFH